MKLTPYGLGGPANPSGYFYTDALAIYQGKDAAGNWTGQPSDPNLSLANVLKDAAGELLYINYNIPYQWLADITQPMFRSLMLAWLFSQAPKYTGVLLDDVNFAATANGAMVPPAVNVSGVLSAPVVGGTPITAAQWATDLMNYCSVIRQALKSVFPKYVVIHNTFWRDPQFASGMYTADSYMKEGGFASDTGLTGETGFWSLAALFDWCDSIHKTGGAVHVLETQPNIDCMYSLCCSLLMTNGSDYWESRGTVPDPASAALLATDVGNPMTSRYRTAKGLWMRAFEGGTVFVNEPGAAPVTIFGSTLQPKSAMVAVTA